MSETKKQPCHPHCDEGGCNVCKEARTVTHAEFNAFLETIGGGYGPENPKAPATVHRDDAFRFAIWANRRLWNYDLVTMEFACLVDRKPVTPHAEPPWWWPNGYPVTIDRLCDVLGCTREFIKDTLGKVEAAPGSLLGDTARQLRADSFAAHVAQAVLSKHGRTPYELEADRFRLQRSYNPDWD